MVQGCRSPQLPPFPPVRTAALLRCRGKALALRRLLKEQTHRLLYPRLVVLDYPEIVPTLLQHPQAQLPLGVQGVPGNPSWASRPEATPSSLSLRSPPAPLLSQYQAALLRICRHQSHPGQLPAVYPTQGHAVYGNGGLALAQAFLGPAALG